MAHQFRRLRQSTVCRTLVSARRLLKQIPTSLLPLDRGNPISLTTRCVWIRRLKSTTVGPSTGNVIFEGNIIVRGSVESGYEIKAGQDLTVLDTVEGANLTAGRNMVLLTGIYGKSKSEISAEGNIEARFISDCTVRCGGNIEVSDLIAHCSIECEGMISLGKNGGKGQMYGGRMVATRGVFAHILGSVSETSTLIELAPPRDVIHRLVRIEAQIEAVQKTLEIVEKHLYPPRSTPPDEEDPQVRGYVEKAANLRGTLAELNKEQAVLQEKANASRHARIQAAEAHRGVTLRIGKAREIISELTNGLNFFEPLEEKPPQAS